jgi:N-acetylneuraminate synthase
MYQFYDGVALPFVIAEVGINHNGSVEIAKQLIDMAKECGANAVKFQKRTLDVVYTKEFLDGPRESPWGTTQREQKEGLEFGKEQYDEIDAYCKKVGIPWFASAWDKFSQSFLRDYDLPFNKVASAMLTNWPLVKEIAYERKPTFISTGMSSYTQIAKCVDIFRDWDCPFTLMHTVSTYPCRDEDCNLNVIRELIRRFDCPVGYSGHETGLLPSILASGIGIVALERHITVDRCMYGSDQAASLERRGLELLVRDCRMAMRVMGDGIKRITEGERKTEQSLRYFRER